MMWNKRCRGWQRKGVILMNSVNGWIVDVNVKDDDYNRLRCIVEHTRDYYNIENVEELTVIQLIELVRDTM